jgi:hypothetical protein
LIPKPLRDSKLPFIWRFIAFLGQKNSPAKYRHKSGIKIVFFFNGPKPIPAGH